MNHTFFKTGDKDAPEVIKDPNGEVVLNLCRVCGQAEADLWDSCPGKKNPLTLAIERAERHNGQPKKFN